MEATPKGCVGCGILSADHPVAAILNGQENKDGSYDTPEGYNDFIGEPGPYGFVAAPCCKECHENPEHRVRPIKGHFCMMKDVGTFVQRAGSNVAGGGIGG